MLTKLRSMVALERYDHLNQIYELLGDHGYIDLNNELTLYWQDVESKDPTDVVSDITGLVVNALFRALTQHGVVLEETTPLPMAYAILHLLLKWTRSEDYQLIIDIIETTDSADEVFLEIINEYTYYTQEDVFPYLKSVERELVMRMAESIQPSLIEQYETTLVSTDGLSPMTEIDKDSPLVAAAVESLLPSGMALEYYVQAMESQFDLTSPTLYKDVYDLVLYSGCSGDKALSIASESLEDWLDGSLQYLTQQIALNKYHESKQVN